MSNIPFLHPEHLKERQLELPDRQVTASYLQPFRFDDRLNDQGPLQGYRALYALDQLPGYHWQGYCSVEHYRVHVQVFCPQIDQHKVQGTVWLIHGYLEHSAIYQPMIAELLIQGFNVITFDLPGHGLSNGDEAGITDFNDYQRIFDALHRQMQQFERLSRGTQLGIGQSTGGAILMHHLLDRAQQRQEPYVQRVLLLSPLVRPAKSAWWHTSTGLNLIKRVTRKVPRHFKRNNHNPEFLRFVRLQDPLQARTMSMDWIIAMTRWMEEMEQRPPCRIPVWVAQGARDQTVDWQYNIAFIRRKFRLQTCLILEEGSHQLINERADIRAALTGLIPAFLHAKTKSNFYY